MRLSDDDVIQALYDSEKLSDKEKIALIATYKTMIGDPDIITLENIKRIRRETGTE
jgi:hypothetical protein